MDFFAEYTCFHALIIRGRGVRVDSVAGGKNQKFFGNEFAPPLSPGWILVSDSGLGCSRGRRRGGAGLHLGR